MKTKLTAREVYRYSRHLVLKDFGLENQLKLSNAHVLVIGCGGLGSPVLLYLTAAGVGHIGIVENDVVDETNLQRQILFDESAIGESKLDHAMLRLQAMNGDVHFTAHQERLSSQNALEIFKNYDLIIDVSDNFPTRYLVNDACEILDKPFVYGAIHQFEGQAAVFNWKGSATYRDLFPSPPSLGLAPNCAEMGVLGVLPGIIGSIQASEAIKVMTGIGRPLVNQLFVIDTLTMVSRTLKISKNLDRKPITSLIDYDHFCGFVNFQTITQAELTDLENYQLIDVRTETEYTRQNIGGVNIPLADLQEKIHLIDPHKKIILHCQSGIRAQQAVAILAKKINASSFYVMQVTNWKV